MTTDRSAPYLSAKLVPNGGRGTPIDITERLVQLEYDDSEPLIDKCDLTIDNFDLSLFDDANWKKGNVIIVQWGYAGNLSKPRKVVIQKITGFTVWKIEALGTSILMNKNPLSRVFDNVKRSDIVATIALEEGYTSDRQFIDDTEVVFEHVQQAKMTNGQMIAHLASVEGFQFYVDFTGLHFHRRKMTQKPVRTFVYYNDPGQGDVLDIQIENDVTATPSTIVAVGRDVLKKKDINVVGSNTDTKRDGLAPVMETVDYRTKTTLTQAIAARHVIASTAPSAAAAKREADGKFIQASQTAILLTMKVVGDPTIEAKTIVLIQGISKRLSGRYYVRIAKTTISASEYVMTLTCRSDGGHGGAGQSGQASDATVNTKPVADPNALTPVEVVDPRTKTTKTIYKRGGAT